MRKSNKRIEMGEEEWAKLQKEKKNAKRRKWREANLESYLFYKRRLKQEMIAYKGGKCELCGYSKDCPSAYDFHHIDPTQKEFTISKSSSTFKAKKAELDKCQLLCRNCHAEVHDKLELEKKLRRINQMGR